MDKEVIVMTKVKRKKPKNDEHQKPQEKSRKLVRKEQRLEKKNRRVAYFAKKTEWKKSKDTLLNPIKEQSSVPKGMVKKGKNFQLESKGTPGEEAVKSIKKEHEAKDRLEKEMAKQRRIQLLQANKEEDRNIRRLEKLLKLDKKKKKSIPKSFYEDNLGSLLEVCDRDYLKKLAETEKTIHDSGSEFEEDFAAVTGKKLNKKKNSSAVKKESFIETAESDESSDNDLNESASDSHDDDLLDESVNSSSKTVKISKTVPKKTEAAQKLLKNTKSDPGSLDDDDISEDDDYGHSDEEGSDDFDGSDFGLGVDDGSDSESDNNENDVDFNDDDSENSAGEQLNKKETRKRVHFSDEGIDKKLTKKQRTESCLPDLKKLEGILKEKGKLVADKKEKHNPVKNVGGKKNVKSNDITSDSDASEDDDDDNADFNNSGDDVGEDDLTDEDDDLMGSDDESEDKPIGAVKKNPDGTWEDIYGRLRSSTGDVIEQGKTAKYIPPALRAQASDSKRKELERLRRQTKGLLNRLAENNMASISSQLDEMYMTNSRHDMNDSLTQLTLEALVSPVLTPDRLVMEHCLLISLLHANVGSEVGAHFLQAVVKKFDELLSEDTEVEDKRLDNIVHIISHLYNFKIFSASLIFAILNKASECLNEKTVDLLLLILRTVGSTLRKDDPNALKSLVLQLQTKAAATPELQKNSRVKFMLEVLLAIKNNNMSKIPNYSPENIEHAKKLLRSLIRRGKYVTELNISLDDLLKADERGRWWIVGSAWTGHLPGETATETVSNPKKLTTESSGLYSTELLELARKQRMNTDTRRNIFCILLTAEDYLDAFEKLLHLNLKNQQEQEIIHVILHCALQEKTFNPYYAHLAQKFCDFDRKYQMKIQYCVWDKLKDLASLQNFQITNLARLLAHLFLEKGLPISVLKVVSFAEIDKISVRLIRQILLNVLLVEDRNESEAVFLRVAPSPKLRLFREGLRLFIRHFMLRPSNTKFLSEEELALLEDRAAMAEKALSAAESEVQF